MAATRRSDFDPSRLERTTLRILRPDTVEPDALRPASDPAARATVYGKSDVGRQRANNEDNFLVATLERALRVEGSSIAGVEGRRVDSVSQGRLLVVADGVGGYGGGELASAVAVDAMATYALQVMPWIQDATRMAGAGLVEGLQAALEDSQRRMREAARRHGEDPRLGTTLTMAYVLWPDLHLVHVGDSRAYLYRGTKLYQLTKDHTVAQELVEEHSLTEEQARTSQFSNVLTRALGGNEETIGADLYGLKLCEGDMLLLCSDGLTSELADDELAEHLAAVTSPEHVELCVVGLIEAANDAGGHDNVTVVLARF